MERSGLDRPAVHPRAYERRVELASGVIAAWSAAAPAID